MSDSARRERSRLRKLLRDQENRPMHPGEQWYLVSARWYRACIDWSQVDDESTRTQREKGQRPGEIDNSSLVTGVSGTDDPVYGPKLKDRLRGSTDYEIICEAVWKKLHKWYGGGPAIPRRVIEEGVRKTTRVEVNPLYLRCYSTDVLGHTNPTSEITVVMSKKNSMKELKSTICSKMDLNPVEVRLWSIHHHEHKLLQNEVCNMMINLERSALAIVSAISAKKLIGFHQDETLEELCIADTQKILAEVKMDDGEWPKSSRLERHRSRGGIMRAMANFLGFGYAEPEPPKGKSYQPGLCGLYNLGNTCFMNSALQCLSNTVPLVDYFVSDRYKKEINTRNNLGMKGQMAEEYGELLKQMWSGGYSAVAPKSLKWVISKYAPQFNGYSQHDSQELVSFLLDGLHEDLNFVTKKPYVELSDYAGRADEIVAEEHWQAHLKRNRSAIVDIFQGQLKSKLRCPECDKISITFDPFMFLSLSLPTERTRVFEVVLFRYDEGCGDYPEKYCVEVSKFAKVGALKEKIGEVCDLDPDDFLLANIYGGKIYTYYSDERSVASIPLTDILMAYVLPDEDEIDDDSVKVHVVHRMETRKTSFYSRSPYEVIGIPFVLYLHPSCTGRELYEMVWKRVKRIATPDKTREKNKARNGCDDSPSEGEADKKADSEAEPNEIEEKKAKKKDEKGKKETEAKSKDDANVEGKHEERKESNEMEEKKKEKKKEQKKEKKKTEAKSEGDANVEDKHEERKESNEMVEKKDQKKEKKKEKKETEAKSEGDAKVEDKHEERKESNEMEEKKDQKKETEAKSKDDANVEDKHEERNESNEMEEKKKEKKKDQKKEKKKEQKKEKKETEAKSGGDANVEDKHEERKESNEMEEKKDQKKETEAKSKDDANVEDKHEERKESNKMEEKKKEKKKEKKETEAKSEGDAKVEDKHEERKESDEISEEDDASPKKKGHTRHLHGSKSKKEYPFRLSVVSSSGLSCARCSYTSDCWGCHIHRDHKPTGLKSVYSAATVAIEWKSDIISNSEYKIEKNGLLLKVNRSCHEVKKREKREVNLNDCLKLFTSDEQLGPEDPWYCPNCKKHMQAFKKFDLWRLPEILVVHLKRFQYSRLFRDKISTDVGYPVTGWDLSSFVPPQPQPPIYDLFAISCHSGGLGGGHYTAMACNKDDSSWYHFNDSSCTRSSPPFGHGSEAYVLFYQRRGAVVDQVSSGGHTLKASAPSEVPVGTPPESSSSSARKKKKTTKKKNK